MSKEVLIDYTSFEISPQMIKESEEKNSGRDSKWDSSKSWC